MQEKKLHIISVLVFILLILCFYLLGGGTNVESEEILTNSFNTELPEANLDDLSENRLDAIYRAELLKEKNERLENRQNNSFRWLTQKDEVSSIKVVEDTLEEIIKTEDAEKPIRRYSKRSSSSFNDRELFEKEKQILLEQKKRELEERLGIAKTEEEKIDKSKVNYDIVVGKASKKGFYSVCDEDETYKSDIRALVHGEYKNISTGAVVKFRIIDEFTINGIHIPKNTFLYGQVSFRSGRAIINIENIQHKNKIIPFQASIYDQDGFEGLYTPDNMTDEAKRKVANDVIASTDLNISGGIPIVTSATNAITSAIKSVSQSAIRDKKLNISSNYQVNIRYEK